MIITDNSSQFTAEEFEQFFIGNGNERKITAPYHPSTNGEAERFVKTLMQKHKGPLQKNLCQFQLHYQSTPYTATGKLLLRSCLAETSRPEWISCIPSKERNSQLKSEASFGNIARELVVREAVWMRNY